MTDPLTTRIAVAIHGATPPNPDAALALHRAQAERVLPVVEAEVARLRAAVEGVLPSIFHTSACLDADMLPCRCGADLAQKVLVALAAPTADDGAERGAR